LIDDIEIRFDYYREIDSTITDVLLNAGLIVIILIQHGQIITIDNLFRLNLEYNIKLK